MIYIYVNKENNITLHSILYTLYYFFPLDNLLGKTFEMLICS